MRPMPKELMFLFNRSFWLYLLVIVVFAVSVNFKKASQQRTHYLLGVFYNQDLTNYNDGIVYFDYLSHQRPRDARNYFFLGYCYLYSNDYLKAMRYFERALNLAPDDELTQQYLAYVKGKISNDGSAGALPAGEIQIPIE